MNRNQFLSLCVSFFIIFTVALSLVLLLSTIYKQRIRMINAGICDDEIKDAYIKNKKHKKLNGIINKISTAFSYVLFSIFFCCFAFSLYAQVTDNYFPVSGMYNASVVLSGSMSEVHEKNGYIEENNLTDQFEVYDIVVIIQILRFEFRINNLYI